MLEYALHFSMYCTVFLKPENFSSPSPLLLPPILDSIPLRSAVFGEGNSSLHILLDDLECTGDETSLLDCIASADIGNSDCDHSEDAGVRCKGRQVHKY